MNKEKAIYVLEMNNPFMGGEEQRNLSEALDIAMKAIEGKHYERAIFIPDGATNGDMIKLVFNAEDIGLDYFRNQWGVHMADGYDRYFNLDWWNAPYKGGKEE